MAKMFFFSHFALFVFCCDAVILLVITVFPKILNSSCELQAEVLTCVCISVSKFPSPTITWPLLENLTEFSVITTVSNHTVNSTVTLTVKDHGNRSVECVARNKNGEVKQNINIQRNHVSEGTCSQLLHCCYFRVLLAFLVPLLSPA